jgi:hypothetical protein
VVVPETVKVFPPIVRLDPAAIFTFVHAEVEFTVTVNPPSINALSPAAGTLAPPAPPEVADQVDAEPQLPVATEYLLAPSAQYGKANIKNRATAKKTLPGVTFRLMLCCLNTSN